MAFSTEYILWYTIWFFTFGAVIGSFLNVVILRHEAGKALTGRSVCSKCGHILTAGELIPIFSYIIQKGACRKCSEHISAQYPLVEFATSMMFALVFLSNFPNISLTPYIQFLPIAKLFLELCIWSLLIVITVYDLRTKLIPNVFSYTFAVLALVLAVLTLFTSGSPTSYLQPLLSLLAGPLLFLPFWALWRISDGRWMGLGDGKLALGIGWFLGLEYGGSAILMSFWMGAGVSLLIMAYQRMQVYLRSSNHQHPSPNLSLKSEIPFGPFMVIGTLYVYLFHWSIVSFIY